MSIISKREQEVEKNRDKFYDVLPVDGAGNLYYNGAKANSTETDAYIDTKNKITIELTGSEDKPKLKTNLFDVLPDEKVKVISSAILGCAFESEQRFENADGSEIVFDEDYFGNHRSMAPIAGPFASAKDADKELFIPR